MHNLDSTGLIECYPRNALSTRDFIDLGILPVLKLFAKTVKHYDVILDVI